MNKEIRKSDTPRTDAATEFVSDLGMTEWVSADFARELEHENTILREALERFRGQFDCYECTGTAEDVLDSLD